MINHVKRHIEYEAHLIRKIFHDNEVTSWLFAQAEQWLTEEDKHNKTFTQQSRDKSLGDNYSRPAKGSNNYGQENSTIHRVTCRANMLSKMEVISIQDQLDESLHIMTIDHQAVITTLLYKRRACYFLSNSNLNLICLILLSYSLEC